MPPEGNHRAARAVYTCESGRGWYSIGVTSAVPGVSAVSSAQGRRRAVRAPGRPSASGLTWPFVRSGTASFLCVGGQGTA
ncbi:predicted protein [Streptomyces viridosporus ATCC 14672]|uniref:Predicted protein n=1 Tax=Streptomyces viridosporus (strain ATCC 14672 / DSM 40746 / JCM 4963 / KCTC 9882 / NRRL B-12104 / FH 1290) TaxID=566461 RepID=D5ZWD1_STRV1|nr:predicted protein [Streptomyces viridosporus ATCC 14672]